MPKTKSGEKISWKEFGSRFKEGVEGITQLQQLKIQIQGTWISLLGIILGIIVNFFFLKSFWWVIIILIGALIVTGISQVGQYQKYWSMKQMEIIINSTITNNINSNNINKQEEIKKDGFT